MPDIRELQARTETFLKAGTRAPGGEVLGADFAAPTEAEGRVFSHFDPEDQRQAMELVARFIAAVEARGGGEEGIAAALDEAARAALDYPLEMVKYALMVFITHHREGSRLPIPPLAERAPELLVKGQTAPTGVLLADTETPADPEQQLDWFREDISANEHHEHWHIVYPFGGIQGRLKDRQGELFLYMHEQMLARYDTERLGVGLPPAVPFSDYRQPIAEGYDSGIPGFTPRPAGLQLVDLPGFYTVAAHEARRDRIFQAVEDGVLVRAGQQVPITIDLLGATEESSIGSASGSDPRSFYGAHHNFGHVLISEVTSQTGATEPGVMADTATAIRDPIFYRWHRHVDDVSFTWQEKQPGNDFSDAPAARVRKALGAAPTPVDTTAGGHHSPDIILAFRESLPGGTDPGFNGQAFGEQRFGGTHWDEDFASGELTTAELETRMLTRVEQGFPVTYLDQKEFVYFIRAENLLDQAQDVTVRLWLVATEKADDRRWWIELDKFRQTLTPGQKAVIYRPAWLSSVVRKPAAKPPQPVRRTGTDPRDNYCECGWPYNLLLPRGTKEGMPFRLLALLTAWPKDDVAADGTCGSMSFCGARDRYPDKRAMGYPFDRPFPEGIEQAFAGLENAATRDITIRWVDEEVPAGDVVTP